MSRQEFRMDLFITKTLSQRPKSTNLSARFRNYILRRLNIINSPGSGERLVLAGSTSSAKVKSLQLETCRHFFCGSGHVPENSSILIRTVYPKLRSLNILLDPRLAGTGIFRTLALWL